MIPRAHGIDVSHHHRVVDWDKVRAQGFDIFGAKATNGQGIDIAFSDHVAGARDSDFELVVYYHFPTSRSSAVSQADRFVDVVGNLRENERLCLDVERDRNGTDDPTDDWTPPLQFVEEFTRELMRLVPDRRHFVYTSARVWHDELGSPTWPTAVGTALWAPRYRSGALEPPLPVDRNGQLVWPRWTMWQDSETYSCPGVDGPCDHDVFAGTPEDLRRYVAIAPA